MTDQDYVTVDTQEKMDQFIYFVDGFHDALLREAAIVCRGYVDTEGCMHNSQGPKDARLIFHSQFADVSCVEVVFEEVTLFRLEDDRHLDLDPTGTVLGEGAWLWITSKGNGQGSVVAAASMKYRALGRECLGKRLRAVEPIIVEQED